MGIQTHTERKNPFHSFFFFHKNLSVEMGQALAKYVAPVTRLLDSKSAIKDFPWHRPGPWMLLKDSLAYH